MVVWVAFHKLDTSVFQCLFSSLVVSLSLLMLCWLS